MRELYRVDIKKNHMDEEERKQYTEKIGLILNGEIKTADLSVKEVKNISEAVNGTADEKFIEILQNDSRAGVKKLGEKLLKQNNDYIKELDRLEEMKFYEKTVKSQGIDLVCGIDEAGRGPLAGPVVAAAVILPDDLYIEYLNDSKKLNEEKREAIYDVIMEKALHVGVGISSNERIDEINILNATYEAMKSAIENMDTQPQYLLIDAATLKDVDIMQMPIVKGDAKSVSIAAASVIAKVTRDRLMKQYDEVYPGYHFSGHKGYGTKEHYAAIKKIGASPIHRMSFLKETDLPENNE